MSLREVTTIVLLTPILYAVAMGIEGGLFSMDEPHLIRTCTTMVIFTAAMLLNLWSDAPRQNRREDLFLFFGIIGVIAGLLSSVMIVELTHDKKDGGPSMGLSVEPVFLTVFYPLCFGVFCWWLRFLKMKVLRVSLLFSWIVIAGVLSFFTTGDYDPTDPGFTYDSNYFSLETKFITPWIVSTVLVFTIFIAVCKERGSDVDSTVKK